jgi:hypothetical protein
VNVEARDGNVLSDNETINECQIKKKPTKDMGMGVCYLFHFPEIIYAVEISTHPETKT